jgi:hypothetical protein
MLDPNSKVIPEADQLVVPLARPPPPRLLSQMTSTTPTLSEAVPETVTVALPVL